MRRGNAAATPQRLSAARLADLVPSEALVTLLSRAALTGKLATFDDRGREVAEATLDLTPDQRVKIAEGLLGKVMAAPQRVALEAAPTPDILRDAALVKSISTEALYAVIQSASREPVEFGGLNGPHPSSGGSASDRTTGSADPLGT